MRVCLVNHGTASEWGGGDSVQIHETAKRLKERGHTVDIQNSDKPDIREADIVHIFNCRVYNSFKGQFLECKRHNKPIVVSPIWISINRALWGSRGSFAILQKGIKVGDAGIRSDLTMLKERRLKVDIEGKMFCADETGRDEERLKETGKMLKEVNGLLINSWLELKALQNDLSWYGDNYDVGYYGVDSSIFMNADEKEFRSHTGITGPFIMQAGRIEPGKNQAMLCWALKGTNIPIVLIGGSKHWPAYAQLCREICGDQVKIIDHLPQRMLASAYASASAHCLPSWMDTCGLVSLEAAINRTPLWVVRLDMNLNIQE